MRRSDAVAHRPETPCQQVVLMGLHERAHRGHLLASDEQTTVRTLMEYLGIKWTKHLYVVDDRESFFLSQPLGPYYTRITVPHRVIHKPEVVAAWNSNPIELAEVFEITSGDHLKNSGLQECPVVSLHFKTDNIARMLPDVLMELKLRECVTLEIRNLGIKRSQVPGILRLMNWPKLKSIILKG
jgi:hypothetical protein